MPLQLQHKGQRSAVLRSIKRISSQAIYTLVLDSDIQRLRTDSPYQEALMRIAYSSWSSRLWTLQEAIYAEKLFFQYLDGAVELEILMDKCRDERSELELPWISRLPYTQMRKYLNSRYGRHGRGSREHYALLLKALEGRRTSDVADEPLVLANVLGLETEEIFGGTDRPELSAFWRVQSTNQKRFFGCRLGG